MLKIITKLDKIIIKFQKLYLIFATIISKNFDKFFQ